LEISHTSYFCEATQLILGSALLRFNTRLCNKERFFEGIVCSFPTFRRMCWRSGKSFGRTGMMREESGRGNQAACGRCVRKADAAKLLLDF
jgi:hypothetical protein